MKPTRRKSPTRTRAVNRQPNSRASRRWLWAAAAVLCLTILVIAAVLWLFPNGPQPPPIPSVPTAQLDESATQLIEAQLQAARIHPNSAEAWGTLGGVLKSFEFRDQALVCLAHAERLAPQDPRWPYLQARLLAVPSTSNALAKLRRTVALCGNTPDTPRLRLARLLMETGQRAEARRQLEELLGTQPDHGPARLALAQIAQSEGRWDEALALAQGCTTDAHTARTAWTLLSALHWRRGDTNAAQFASRKAAAVTPDVPIPDPYEDAIRQLRGDARSLSDQAQECLMAGHPSEARPHIERLVREHPQFANTWLLLGRMLVMEKKPVEAEQALLRHLALDPRSINGHFQLGMSLLAQQRYPEAAATFQLVTTLKPDLGPAFFNLGFALAKAGRKGEALIPFREAIRHNPEYIDSYILLADLCLQLGNTTEASELVSLAERLNPADPRLRVLRRKIQAAQ